MGEVMNTLILILKVVSTLILITGLISTLILLGDQHPYPYHKVISILILILLGDQPDPAEVFTVVRVTENRIALKSGYSRYVSVNSAGELIGRVEAIGPRETWEPVFEEVSVGKCLSLALLIMSGDTVTHFISSCMSD